MAKPDFTFEFDTERDGTYGGSIDDISDYIISAFWNEGMGNCYDEMAPPAKLQLTLRNLNGEFTSAALGNNIIVNGTFSSWGSDNPSNWTVTGEVGTDPEVSEVGANEGHGGTGTGACNLYTTSADISIRQSSLVVGKTYQITVTVTNIVSGAVQLINGGRVIGHPIWQVGTYTFYCNANATLLYIQNWYACDVTVDSVVVKETALYKPLLRIGTLGRLKASWNGTTYTMFEGRLSTKAPTQGMASIRQIVLTFDDPMIDMLYGDYKPDLQQNVTVDAAISPVFDLAKVAFPYSHAYWMLGIPGTSELGENTYLFSPASTSFDTGYTTLDFVGDISTSTGVGVNPQNFIQQMVAAEAGGRFFYNPRTAAFTFHNRNRDTLNTTVVAAITEDDFESDKSLLSEGAALENQCTLTFQPREQGTEGTVLWTATNTPIRLGGYASYKTTAKFQDINNGNGRIGALNIMPPSTGTDIIVTTLGGTPSPKSVVIGVTYNATTADFTITNRRGAVRLITTLQIRGTPLYFYDTKSVIGTNGSSIRDTRLATNSLSIPAISNETFAQSYVDYRVSKFGTPEPHLERIGFFANDSDARMDNALSLTVGSRISVTESWDGLDEDYIVVGANHRMMIGGDNELTTTLILKPISREIYWVLGIVGYSELGSTTKVAF